jgi:hypothetical protein
MVQVFRRFPYTASAMALACTVAGLAMTWDINVFDLPELDFIGIENNEIGEVVVACLFIFPAFFVDHVLAGRRAHEDRLQDERLRVLRMTMRTVQDIVNNNLNQLQLLRIDAVGHVPDASVALFDQVIRDTATELTTLGNIEVFIEKPMEIGPGLKSPAWLQVDPIEVNQRLDVIQDLADELGKCGTDVVHQLDLSSRLHQQVQAAKRAMRTTPAPSP